VRAPLPAPVFMHVVSVPRPSHHSLPVDLQWINVLEGDIQVVFDKSDLERVSGSLTPCTVFRG